MISSVKSCFFTVFSGLVKSFGSFEVYCFVNGFGLCKILRGLLIHCCCSGRGCEYLVVFWQICKKELNKYLNKLIYLLRNTEGPCLMRLLFLEKIRISQIFALCDFLTILFHYCDLPNANFGLFYFISVIFCLFFAKITVMK